MEKNELLNKWKELTTTWTGKKAELESCIQKWLDSDPMLNNESVQQILDTTTEEIEQLKKLANETISKYSEICYEESLKEKNLEVAEVNVRTDVRTDSNGFTITSDFKSANTSETEEEKYEQKRQSIITQIRSRVANKEMSLDSASKAKDYFNETYNHSQKKEDMWNDMHR